MSTRAVIARVTGETWVGRYHHFDGYPTALGKGLWDLLHGHFAGDLAAMLAVLIDQHPAGWSSIVECDFSLEPGIERMNNKRPRCYCHGGTDNKEWEIQETDTEHWLEWGYVFDEATRQMRILHWYQDTWLPVTRVALDGPEPEWKVMEAFRPGQPEYNEPQIPLQNVFGTSQRHIAIDHLEDNTVRIRLFRNGKEEEIICTPQEAKRIGMALVVRYPLPEIAITEIPLKPHQASPFNPQIGTYKNNVVIKFDDDEVYTASTTFAQQKALELLRAAYDAILFTPRDFSHEEEK